MGLGGLATPAPIYHKPAAAIQQQQKGRAHTTHRGLDPLLSAIADDPDRGPVRHHDKPPMVGKERYALVRYFGDWHAVGPRPSQHYRRAIESGPHSYSEYAEFVFCSRIQSGTHYKTFLL